MESNRIRKGIHANAAAVCAEVFKYLGLETQRAHEMRDGYDLLVGGDTRVAVRYALAATDRRQAYQKKNGDISHYAYKRWTFNFHRHGKKDERYCDYFVCLLSASDPRRPYAETDVRVFVIPWDAVTGLTFCSSQRAGSTRAYRGQYARFQDGWNLMRGSGDDNGNGSPPAAGAAQPDISIRADARQNLRFAAARDRIRFDEDGAINAESSRAYEPFHTITKDPEAF